MKLLIAWRLTMHDRVRSLMVIVGIFIATLLMFLQLGFYAAVPKASTLIFEDMPFDIMLTSPAYVYQGSPHALPRHRLTQAAAHPEVVETAPLYIGTAQWLSPESGLMRGATILGIALDRPAFRHPGILAGLPELAKADTILVDTETRAMYGPQTAGRLIELADRQVMLGGTYALGTGFVGLAVAVVSDINFHRILPARPLHSINMGLVRVAPEGDVRAVAEHLRALLPADTRVFTRKEFFAHEQARWTRATSAGLIFGFGAAVAMLVGVVITYQMLATQITRDLPRFATLKAIGYGDGALVSMVVGVSLLMAAIAYPLAAGASFFVYDGVRAVTRLPVEMTMERLALVFTAVTGMAAGSALLATRRLLQADPADNF